MHLVYQRPSEGLVHYRIGTLTPDAVDESDMGLWSCAPFEQGWQVTGIPLPMEWILYDALGRTVQSGTSPDGRIPASFRGAGILDVRAKGQRRAFRVQR